MTTTAVAATMTIDEALRRWPSSVRAFARRRMACAGCAMAPFDTVCDAAAAYGIDEGTLLEEIRRDATGVAGE
ncbi:MAG TPA: hypothetical protein VLW17_07460 [Thermoanaerobaculaceae bacterium]|nr:hypothetical protein [Thermoanaerobaculaceae bacterium]